MSSGLLLGIDEGTTAVKAALFDSELHVVAEARRPVPVAHPRPGWVEQDPELILEAVVDAVAEVLEHSGGREVIAAGLDHQGESVLGWDASSGRALTPVLVWQDKRQESLLAEIAGAADAGARQAVDRSGLPLDPYFSAGKLAWLLGNDERRAPGSGRGLAAPRHGRRVPDRSHWRAFRHRPLDGVANPAARGWRARLG